MSASVQEIKALLASPELAAVEDGIALRTGQSVVHRDGKLWDRIQRELRLTPLTVENVLERLQTRRELLIDFGVAFLGDAEATEETEEYPPGEAPDPDDLPKTIKQLGLACGSGVKYLIYVYFLLERDQKDFVSFLKQVRIPGANKFAGDLKRVLAGVGRSGTKSQ